MQIQRLDVGDTFVITPARFGDHRGYFSETFRKSFLSEAGVDLDFVQDNHVHSSERGVLRGLHYQIPPCAQGKLVRCVRGSILDVAVDIRNGSPTFSRHVAIELSAENSKQLWVPPGFAHGYVTLERDCEVIYKVCSHLASTHRRRVLRHLNGSDRANTKPVAGVTPRPRAMTERSSTTGSPIVAECRSAPSHCRQGWEGPGGPQQRCGTWIRFW